MDSARPDAYYEDETDLREYLRVLIRHWRLVAATTILAALAALAVSLIMQPTYEATALVAITGARYEFQFNPSVEVNYSVIPVRVPPYKAMLALATADDLLQAVFAEMRAELPTDVVNLDGFRGMLEAKASSDPSVLELTASAETPSLASEIASTWANRFVAYVNDIYQRNSEDLTFFAAQAEETRGTLEETEQDLIEFQARNEAAVLQARLGSRMSLLSSYLATQNSLTIINRNVRALRSQLEALPPDSASGLGDDLAALGLQILALNAGSGTPIQIQLAEGASLSNRTAGEQAGYLADLQETIGEQLVELNTAMEPLPGEILALQGQIQELDTEGSRLATARDLARESYLSVSRKLEETRLLSQSTEGDARLASLAATPVRPASPRKLLNTALAGALGLMLGVFAVFLMEYLKPMRESSKAAEGAGLSARRKATPAAAAREWNETKD
jgi:uncharacterized protein involved in exopolysaccharide biosynthesis